MEKSESPAERGERYFKTICGVGVFRAEFGNEMLICPERNPDYRSLHIYPRTDGLDRGWVWLIWHWGD